MNTLDDRTHTIAIDVFDAVASGDDAEALSLLDCLSEPERQALHTIAARLAYLADDSNRCEDCGVVVEGLHEVARRMGVTRCKPCQRWHLMTTGPVRRQLAYRMAFGEHPPIRPQSDEGTPDA